MTGVGVLRVASNLLRLFHPRFLDGERRSAGSLPSVLITLVAWMVLPSLEIQFDLYLVA